MLRRAYEKASSRIADAEIAVRSLDVGDPASFEENWATFLLKFCGAFNILEQGAKKSPASKYWFGLVKNRLSEDPLLNYLKKARNSEEHGLDCVVIFEPSRTEELYRGPMLDIQIHWNPDGTFYYGAPREIQYAKYQRHPQKFVLSDVAEPRSGKLYKVPTEHLGKELADCSPKAVAMLAISYANEVLVDARERIIE